MSRKKNKHLHPNPAPGAPASQSVSDTANTSTRPLTEHPKNEDRNSEKWYKNPEWWMVGLTTAIAVTGFITLFVFEAQLQEMHSSTQEMHSSSVSSQRAWVGIVQPVRSFQATLGPPHIAINGNVSIKNLGTSPAMKVITVTSVAPATGNHLEKVDLAAKNTCDAASGWFDFKDEGIRNAAQAREQGWTLFPGEEYDSPFAAGIASDPQVDTIYLVGCTYYRDQFGAKRHTQFCVFAPAAAITNQTVFNRCVFHNDAD